MAIQPKNLNPPHGATGKKYVSASTLGVTAVSLKATFNAIGISPIAYWVANDEASGANLLVGDSSSQPIAIKAGGDLTIPAYADDVWIAAASGTITFYVIAFGT
jgi:hypothetical protein